MAKIISNRQLNKDFFLMYAETEAYPCAPGQFFMLRAGDKRSEYPLLSRPVSVFDCEDKVTAFLYKKVGKGTEIISLMTAGEEIEIRGPYGNGFPTEVSGNVALVGGGVGIAPLYFLAKKLKSRNEVSNVDLFLGFSGEPVLADKFEAQSDSLRIKTGGFITDDIDPEPYDAVFTCGPEIMMRVLYRKCLAQGAEDRLYVSMEKRMACGIGICKVCTCFTKESSKTVCKDGPVFSASEVFYDEEGRA